MAAAARHGLDELGVVVERGVVDEGGELDAVALHLGGRAIGVDRGHEHGPAVDIGVAQRPGKAVGHDETRVPERLGQRVLQVDAARRPEVAEEVRQAAAGQARAQQPDEEGRRHGDQRADGQPEDGLRARAGHEVVGQQGGEEQQRDAPRDARQQGAPARWRRRPPSHGDHDRDRDAGEARERALALVDRVGDVRVRERGQEVAVLLAGTAARRPAGSRAPARRRPPAASPRATRAGRPSAASAPAPRRTAPTAPAPGSTRSARAAGRTGR